MAERKETVRGKRRLTAEQERQYEQLRREAEKQRKKEKSRRKVKSFAALGVFVLIVAVSALLPRLFAEKRPQPSDKLSVHFIDVGQGDCTYLTAGGVNMLIDCGYAEYADEVTEYLKSCGVKRLDYVIGTHPHADHMGGMADIIEAFDVGEFIMPAVAQEDIPTDSFYERFTEAAAKNGVTVTEAELYRTIDIGDAQCEVIAPIEVYAGDLNDCSVAVEIRHGENTFLLTGDAGEVSETAMLAGGRLTHADVYKVGHHGSGSASTEDFLRTVSPDIAVISCGAGNRYGHPNDDTLARLERYTDQIYRTDVDGTVVIRSDGKELEVG